MVKVFEWLGGRKYALSLGFFALITVGLYLKWVSDDQYIAALEWCLVIYLGANVLKELPGSIANVPIDDNNDVPFFKFFGGRKMFLALLFGVAVTVAFATKFITTAEKWIDALEWALVVYLGANAVDTIPKVLTQKSGNGKTALPPENPPAP